MVELGKYAGAVIGSWAATLGLVGFLIVLSLAQGAKVKKRLEEAEARRKGQT